MKAFWNQLRSDLALYRWWLLGVLGMQVMSVLLSFSHEGRFGFSSGVHGIGIMVLLALRLFLILETWLDSSPLSERSFWTTRPIPVPVVYLSKLVVILLSSLGIPAAVGVGLWIHEGLGGAQSLEALASLWRTAFYVDLCCGCFACVFLPVRPTMIGRLFVGVAMVVCFVVLYIALGIADYRWQWDLAACLNLCLLACVLGWILVYHLRRRATVVVLVLACMGILAAAQLLLRSKAVPVPLPSGVHLQYQEGGGLILELPRPDFENGRLAGRVTGIWEQNGVAREFSGSIVPEPSSGVESRTSSPKSLRIGLYAITRNFLRTQGDSFPLMQQPASRGFLRLRTDFSVELYHPERTTPVSVNEQRQLVCPRSDLVLAFVEEAGLGSGELLEVRRRWRPFKWEAAEMVLRDPVNGKELPFAERGRVAQIVLGVSFELVRSRFRVSRESLQLSRCELIEGTMERRKLAPQCFEGMILPEAAGSGIQGGAL